MGLRTPQIKITDDGAICMKLYNRSATTMYKGEIVQACATSPGMAFITPDVDDINPIGTVNETSIAPDENTWIAFAGAIPAKADSGGFLAGQWVGTGATAKLADGDSTPGAVVQHFQEIGHGLEDTTDGNTGRVAGHFN